MYTLTFSHNKKNTLLVTLSVKETLSFFDKEDIVKTLQVEALKQLKMLTGSLSMSPFEKFLNTLKSGAVGHVIIGHDDDGIPMTAWGQSDPTNTNTFVDQRGDRHQLQAFEKVA